MIADLAMVAIVNLQMTMAAAESKLVLHLLEEKYF
jgi:hypothetical protein